MIRVLTNNTSRMLALGIALLGALIIGLPSATLAQEHLIFLEDSGFQDITNSLRPMDVATENVGDTRFLEFEVANGSTVAEQVLVITNPSVFGQGLFAATRFLRSAPMVTILEETGGTINDIPQEVVWTQEGWVTRLNLPANTNSRIAIGVAPNSGHIVAGLMTEAAFDARTDQAAGFRGFLFGASLMLMVLLLARGVLSRQAPFMSGVGVALGLTLVIGTSAGWDGGLVDPLTDMTGGKHAFAILIFLAFGMDFARRAMELKTLSPGPNRLALLVTLVALVMAVAALFVPMVVPFAGPFAGAVVLLSGVVIIEGTRQNVEGPKLLFGPWFLFALAILGTIGLSFLAPPRFGNEGAILIEALFVAATLAATLSIDRLVVIPAPTPVSGITPTVESTAPRGQEMRLRQALSGAQKGVWDWKIQGDRLYLSAGAMRLLGYDAQGGEGSEEAFFSRVHGEDQDTYRERLREEVDRGAGHFTHDLRVLMDDGSYRWLRLEAEVSGSATQSTPRIVGLLSDISDEKNGIGAIADHALMDALTGVASRGLFVDRLTHAVESETATVPPAVIVMNVDRFETINDGVGHAGGDTLLIVLARRLEGVLEDTDFVARLGGDEFGVLIEGASAHANSHERVLDLAETMRDILAEPLEIEGQEIFPSLSFGVAFGSEDDQYDQPLLRRAEVAMYHAKKSGGGRIDTFRPEFAKQKGELMSLEAGLNRALERREIELLYQPIVSLSDGRLAGFEALMRWNHPEHGQMPPGRFLDLAEDTGAIVPLGRYVVEAAAIQLQAWQESYRRKKALFVGVNMSARQILHHDLARDVERLFSKMTLANKSLLVEVTESVVMENPELAQRRLAALSAEGVGLAIDDFGTGYSSLSHLSHFHFDKLKIDRSFVEAMEGDKNAKIIVNAIAALARDLGMDVIAEGVQSETHLRMLRELRCAHGQGYLFGKPLSAAEAERMIINDMKESTKTPQRSAPEDRAEEGQEERQEPILASPTPVQSVEAEGVAVFAEQDLAEPIVEPVAELGGAYDDAPMEPVLTRDFTNHDPAWKDHLPEEPELSHQEFTSLDPLSAGTEENPIAHLPDEVVNAETYPEAAPQEPLLATGRPAQEPLVAEPFLGEPEQEEPAPEQDFIQRIRAKGADILKRRNKGKDDQAVPASPDN